MPPVTLMIKPSSASCNLRCRYCFYFDETDHRETPNYGMMTSETLEKLIRRAIAFADGELSLVFQGGEPSLVGLDFYQDLIRFEEMYNTKGLAIHHSIQTNGYDLSDELLQFLIQHHFLFGISLDGTSETHDRYRVTPKGEGTFKTVKQTLDHILDLGGEANVLCVVTEDIAKEPKRIFNALKPYHFIQFIPCMNSLDGETSEYSLNPETFGDFLIETFDLYKESLQRGEKISVRIFDNYLQMLQGYPPDTCAMMGVCAHYFVAEGNGTIFPCDFYCTDQWKLGNIHEQSFPKMAKGDVAHAFVETSKPKPQACKDCDWLFLCRGGCRRDRPILDDGSLGKSIWCDSYLKFYAARGDELKALSDQVFHANRHS